MTQQKVVKNKAGVDKELKLSNGWDIVKRNDGNYMLCNSITFIHGDKLLIKSKNPINIWLNVYHNDVYIASLWIDNAIEIKKVKKFIKGV